jgi:hypothetical protein
VAAAATESTCRAGPSESPGRSCPCACPRSASGSRCVPGAIRRPLVPVRPDKVRDSVSIRAWESNRMPSRRGLTVNEQQTRQIVSLWDNSMREVLALTNEAGLEQRLTLLEQRVAALPLKKDIWDVLGTLGSLATPLVVAALGIWRLPAWLHSARTRRTIARSRTGFSRSLRTGGKG